MTAPKRILLAGLFNETHTFLEEPAKVRAFEVRSDRELLATRGDGSPMDGFLESAEAFGWEVVPSIDSRGMPGGIVPAEVVEAFWARFSSDALAAGRVDAVFLVLHGAMVAVGCPDVEGEILSRLRGLPGYEGVPVFAILDLHANVTPLMAQHANALVLYRKNPHTDARQTAVRAAALLNRCLEDGIQPSTFYARPPLILAPSATGSADDPMRSLLALARDLEMTVDGLLEVGVAAGFSFADLPEAGMSFLVVADSRVEARESLDRLCGRAWELRETVEIDHLSEDAIREVLKRCEDGPNILVEPSDNIGAGAPGDGTGILRLLLDFADRPSAVVINDPAAVTAVAGLATGAQVELPIGGRGSRFDRGPVRLEVVRVSSSDGRFTLEDPQSHLASMHGLHIDMGPCAVVRHREILILLTSNRTPPFDLGQLRSQGIEPATLWAIGVKAAVAHRRAYDGIARRSFDVATPGPCAGDPRVFDYKRLCRPVHPIDPIADPSEFTLFFP